MRIKGGLIAAAGAALVVGLILWAGPRPVLAAVTAIGWRGFGLVLLSQLLLTSIAAAAWAIVGARTTGVTFGGFLWARFVREAVGQALPFTQVGGIAVGARTLALEEAPGRHAVAVTLADTALEFAGQIAYAALGAVVLERLRPGAPIVAPLTAVLFILAVMAALLMATLMSGAQGIERLVRRLSRRGGDALPVSEALADLRRRPRAAALAGLTHLAGWTMTAAQTWLILHLLHQRVGWAPAVAIDSLTSAARAAAFLAPAGLGVQEGALLVLGHLFGIGAPAAVALSLIRRGRDLTLALPVLGGWRLRHGDRIWRFGTAQAPRPHRPQRAA